MSKVHPGDGSSLLLFRAYWESGSPALTLRSAGARDLSYSSGPAGVTVGPLSVISDAALIQLSTAQPSPAQSTPPSLYHTTKLSCHQLHINSLSGINEQELFRHRHSFWLCLSVYPGIGLHSTQAPDSMLMAEYPSFYQLPKIRRYTSSVQLLP